MLYFLLPHNFSQTYKYLNYLPHEEGVGEERASLFLYLREIKQKINTISKEWEHFKKYTNPYEFIHTYIPNTHKCVANLRPLSRSFFKMIEIYQHFQFTFVSPNIQTFHLAEGPGGFIEAVHHLRRNHRDRYIGMTLQDDTDVNVPGWKKTGNFLRSHPHVVLENGPDGTGNILSRTNFEYCSSKYAGSMDLVTADGGFDFTDNFDDQERKMLKLLFAQISFALSMQKHRGHFVLKIFDIFLLPTLELLFILSSFYERVYITKPDTSRYANAEKYIVCMNFLPTDFSSCLPYFYNVFCNMICTDDHHLHFLSKHPSYYFLSKMEEYNCCFVQQQIETISNTLALVSSRQDEKPTRLKELVKYNLLKCEQWCIKHNIPFVTLNEFRNE